MFFSSFDLLIIFSIFSIGNSHGILANEINNENDSTIINNNNTNSGFIYGIDNNNDAALNRHCNLNNNNNIVGQQQQSSLKFSSTSNRFQSNYHLNNQQQPNLNENLNNHFNRHQNVPSNQQQQHGSLINGRINSFNRKYQCKMCPQVCILFDNQKSFITFSCMKCAAAFHWNFSNEIFFAVFKWRGKTW